MPKRAKKSGEEMDELLKDGGSWPSEEEVKADDVDGPETDIFGDDDDLY
jgi:hypothetical protein